MVKGMDENVRVWLSDVDVPVDGRMWMLSMEGQGKEPGRIG